MLQLVEGFISIHLIKMSENGSKTSDNVTSSVMKLVAKRLALAKIHSSSPILFILFLSSLFASTQLKTSFMKLSGIISLCILAVARSGSSVINKQDRKQMINIEAKFDADLEFYKNHPVKAKKRFSSLLTKLESPKTLNRVRYAKARKNKSMDKARDAIARKMINIMKTSVSRSFPDNDLQKRVNSTMTKVLFLLLTFLVPYGGLGEPSSTRKAQSSDAR
jgi:hypothetical protein